MFLINSYVTMLISLLIPAHGQLSNVEHTDLILLILLIWGKIPSVLSWTVSQENLRDYFKRIISEGEISETLFELIPMLPLIFQRHFLQVFELIPRYVTINFQRHFLEINLCSRDNVRDTLGIPT